MYDVPSGSPPNYLPLTHARSIKKARPLDADTPIFAVKFIHKTYAIKHGRISAKQLAMESSLHCHAGQHVNVIEWFASEEDAVWRWIAMEFAEGGDLFDKIEADVGIAPDIAQMYFMQLVAGTSYLHSKGIAHRDLKPENMMLSSDGILKIADFGMATMFEYKGKRKTSSTLCGSPPYIAPEILACGHGMITNEAVAATTANTKYAPELADIWSCGVILFVLLVGNTPWDEPSDSSFEFQEYKRNAGRSTDSLWEKIPSGALSLLRGMMAVDPQRRFSWTQVRQHPWYTQRNALVGADGRMLDPLAVATRMLENLHIDFSQTPASQRQRGGGGGGMDVDGDDDNDWSAISASYPVAPVSEWADDWERPPIRTLGNTAIISSTQPIVDRTTALFPPRRGGGGGSVKPTAAAAHHRRAMPPAFLADEPTMSQFSKTPGPSMSLTQHARRFRDIVPAEPLTRFLSHVPATLLVQMLSDALHQLNVALPSAGAGAGAGADRLATLRIRTTDERRQRLHGEIAVDKLTIVVDANGDEEIELLEVRFVKIAGDPLEWRRFFKKVVVLCKEGVYVPDREGRI